MATVTRTTENSWDIYSMDFTSSAYPSDRILVVGTYAQIRNFNPENFGIEEGADICYSVSGTQFYDNFFQSEAGKKTIPKRILTTGEMRFNANESRDVYFLLEEIAEKWNIPITRIEL